MLSPSAGNILSFKTYPEFDHLSPPLLSLLSKIPPLLTGSTMSTPPLQYAHYISHSADFKYHIMTPSLLRNFLCLPLSIIEQTHTPKAWGILVLGSLSNFQKPSTTLHCPGDKAQTPYCGLPGTSWYCLFTLPFFSCSFPLWIIYYSQTEVCCSPNTYVLTFACSASSPYNTPQPLNSQHPTSSRLLLTVALGFSCPEGHVFLSVWLCHVCRCLATESHGWVQFEGYRNSVTDRGSSTMTGGAASTLGWGITVAPQEVYCTSHYFTAPTCFLVSIQKSHPLGWFSWSQSLSENPFSSNLNWLSPHVWLCAVTNECPSAVYCTHWSPVHTVQLPVLPISWQCLLWQEGHKQEGVCGSFFVWSSPVQYLIQSRYLYLFFSRYF